MTVNQIWAEINNWKDRKNCFTEESKFFYVSSCIGTLLQSNLSYQQSNK